LWIFLSKSPIVGQLQSQRLLHFAPEPCLAQRFAAVPDLDYVSADLTDPSAMVRMDITQIRFPDDSFDTVLCSHVLEHVADDHRALCEIRRVLKPGGQAIILVPIIGEVTREEPDLADPVKREQLFGQFDHVRVYGRDFDHRLKRAGFSASALSTTDIAGPDEIERMGLPKREIIFVCRKR
jgi:SAM-dependent methyltransferase